MKFEIVNKLDNNALARIFYPGELHDYAVIKIVKGLNTIELSEAIHHEIGHLIDWYLSQGNQSEDVNIREFNATAIGECIRFKESSNEVL